MSKVIRDYFVFALLRFVIGPENSRHFLNQSDSKLQSSAIWLLVFSRASSNLLVFTSSSLWLLVMFSFIWLAVEKRSIQILQRKLKPRLMSKCFNLRQPVILNKLSLTWSQLCWC